MNDRSLPGRLTERTLSEVTCAHPSGATDALREHRFSSAWPLDPPFSKMIRLHPFGLPPIPEEGPLTPTPPVHG